MRVRIREVRLLRGLSLEDLARESGVSESNISRIETHKQTPRPSTMRKLAAALNVSVEDLWEVEEGKLAA
jgi:transcriptional regulator with XRE-family HTH domain